MLLLQWFGSPLNTPVQSNLSTVTTSTTGAKNLLQSRNKWLAKQKPVQGWSQTGDMPCGSQCKAGKHTTRGSTPLQPALLLKKQSPLLHTHIPCSTHLASLKVRCRRRTLEPKVSASMSSVPVAYTRPAFTSAAHCASASHGACATVNHAPVTTAWNTQVGHCFCFTQSLRNSQQCWAPMTTATGTRNTQWEAAVIISMTQCVTISMPQCAYASMHVLLFLGLNFLCLNVSMPQRVCCYFYASMSVLLFLWLKALLFLSLCRRLVQRGTSCTNHLHVGHPHQLEQVPALLAVLPGHLHQAAVEAVNVLLVPCEGSKLSYKHFALSRSRTVTANSISKLLAHENLPVKAEIISV